MGNFYQTENGIKLLKNFGHGDIFSERILKAKRAIKKLENRRNNFLIITKGKKENNIDATYGLPYTSDGDFAAIWNTNTEAKLFNTNNFFEGISIDADNNPVAIFTRRDDGGNELETLYEIIKIKYLYAVK